MPACRRLRKNRANDIVPVGSALRADRGNGSARLSALADRLTSVPSYAIRPARINSRPTDLSPILHHSTTPFPQYADTPARRYILCAPLGQNSREAALGYNSPNFSSTILVGALAVEQVTAAHSDGVHNIENPHLLLEKFADAIRPVLRDSEIGVGITAGIGVAGDNKDKSWIAQPDFHFRFVENCRELIRSRPGQSRFSEIKTNDLQSLHRSGGLDFFREPLLFLGAHFGHCADPFQNVGTSGIYFSFAERRHLSDRCLFRLEGLGFVGAMEDRSLAGEAGVGGGTATFAKSGGSSVAFVSASAGPFASDGTGLAGSAASASDMRVVLGAGAEGP